MLVSNIKSDFTFENFENFVIRKHMKRLADIASQTSLFSF